MTLESKHLALSIPVPDVLIPDPGAWLTELVTRVEFEFTDALFTGDAERLAKATAARDALNDYFAGFHDDGQEDD